MLRDPLFYFLFPIPILVQLWTFYCHLTPISTVVTDCQSLTHSPLQLSKASLLADANTSSNVSGESLDPSSRIKGLLSAPIKYSANCAATTGSLLFSDFEYATFTKSRYSPC